jgi:hypothetical protein
MIEIESEAGTSGSIKYPNGEGMNVYRLSNGNVDVMLSSKGLTYTTVSDVPVGEFICVLASITEQAHINSDRCSELFYLMLRDMFRCCIVAMKGVTV